SARRRAQVRGWELLASEALAPLGRLVMIGRYKAMNLQPLADHFAAKYHWSEAEGARADRVLHTVLPELAAAVAESPYLGGDRFTPPHPPTTALLNPPPRRP